MALTPGASVILQGLSGREFLLQLFTLKRREGALPYDELAIEHAVGVSDKDLVLELLNAGLAADPDERPSAQALLKQVEQAFGLEPHLEEDFLHAWRLPWRRLLGKFG